MKLTPETVVLINFGRNDIQKLARGIRDRGIYTMVMPYTTPLERLQAEKPVGLILCHDGTPRASLDTFKAAGLPTTVDDRHHVLLHEGAWHATVAVG